MAKNKNNTVDITNESANMMNGFTKEPCGMSDQRPVSPNPIPVNRRFSQNGFIYGITGIDESQYRQYKPYLIIEGRTGFIAVLMDIQKDKLIFTGLCVDEEEECKFKAKTIEIGIEKLISLEVKICPISVNTNEPVNGMPKFPYINPGYPPTNDPRHTNWMDFDINSYINDVNRYSW